MRPGDVADRIFLIAAGELEILSPALQPGSAGSSGSNGSGPGVDAPGTAADAADVAAHSEPLITGLDLQGLQEQADPEVWDDATAIADIRAEPGGEQGGAPAARASWAVELSKGAAAAATGATLKRSGTVEPCRPASVFALLHTLDGGSAFCI